VADDRKTGFENLISLGDREDAKAIQSKGGKASVESRRKKKQAREMAQMLLDMKLKDDRYDGVLEEFKIKKGDKNYTLLMLAKAMQKIIATGDVAALEKFLAIAGQSPTDEPQTDEVVRIIDDI
jgi:hypothetical protein